MNQTMFGSFEKQKCFIIQNLIKKITNLNLQSRKRVILF